MIYFSNENTQSIFYSETLLFVERICYSLFLARSASANFAKRRFAFSMARKCLRQGSLAIFVVVFRLTSAYLQYFFQSIVLGSLLGYSEYFRGARGLQTIKTASAANRPDRITASLARDINELLVRRVRRGAQSRRRLRLCRPNSPAAAADFFRPISFFRVRRFHTTRPPRTRFR